MMSGRSRPGYLVALEELTRLAPARERYLCEVPRFSIFTLLKSTTFLLTGVRDLVADDSRG